MITKYILINLLEKKIEEEDEMFLTFIYLKEEFDTIERTENGETCRK